MELFTNRKKVIENADHESVVSLIKVLVDELDGEMASYLLKMLLLGVPEETLSQLSDSLIQKEAVVFKKSASISEANMDDFGVGALIADKLENVEKAMQGYYTRMNGLLLLKEVIATEESGCSVEDLVEICRKCGWKDLSADIKLLSRLLAVEGCVDIERFKQALDKTVAVTGECNFKYALAVYRHDKSL